GGIEQAFVDYGLALTAQGHEVMHLCHPKAALLPLLKQHGLTCHLLTNRGQWDLLARFYANAILKSYRPDMIIGHGNRAILLLGTPARRLNIPLIGVGHNLLVKRFKRLDGAITVSAALRQRVIEAGLPPEQVV